jgi:hypothetical protein
MTFTVVLVPSAEQDLAQAWMDAPDPNAVTAAAAALEADLRRDPLTLGESRGEGTRVAFEGPLGVRFDVSEDDRRVTVRAVWLTQPP